MEKKDIEHELNTVSENKTINILYTNSPSWVFIYRYWASGRGCKKKGSDWVWDWLSLCLSPVSCTARETWYLFVICYHRNLWIFDHTGSSKWRSWKVPESVLWLCVCLQAHYYYWMGSKRRPLVNDSTSGQNEHHSHISSSAIKWDHIWWHWLRSYKWIMQVLVYYFLLISGTFFCFCWIFFFEVQKKVCNTLSRQEMKADYNYVYVVSVHTHLTTNTNIDEKVVSSLCCLKILLRVKYNMWTTWNIIFCLCLTSQRLQFFKKFAAMFVWKENSINIINLWTGFKTL